MTEPIIGDSPGPGKSWPDYLLDLALRHSKEKNVAKKRDYAAQIAASSRVAIFSYVKGRHRMSVDDARDVAAAKSSDLYQKLEAGTWSPVGWNAPRLRGYLASIARNGVADVARQRKRQDVSYLPENDHKVEDSAERRLQGVLFADALKGCLTSLSPTARATWYLKVFFGMSSRDTSNHPAVMTSSAAVDMAWMRARLLVTRCLKRKGFDGATLPPGTYARVWRSLGIDAFTRGQGGE